MSIKLNINIRPLSDLIEKFIVKNLNKRAPKSYAKISNKEINSVFRKTSGQFLDAPVSSKLIGSIRNSWMRDHMIRTHKNLKKNSKKIIDEYGAGKSVLELSASYDISPLNILREVFNDKYSKKLTKLILNTDKLSVRDFSELNLAIENDAYALINQSEIKEDSESFEKDIAKVLDKNNINYKTQEELAKEQIELYGKPINTPDFLITSNLYINGVKINWIDAKNFYGANIPFIKDKIKKQTEKYLKTWGSGCIVFSLGFNEKLHFNNIQIIDYDSII